MSAPANASPAPRGARVELMTLSSEEAARLVARMGWPSYRSRQLLRWLYRGRVRRIDDMTDLSVDQRGALAALADIRRFPRPGRSRAADGTTKFLFSLHDGLAVESVLIPDGRRLTLCLSTQVGCTLDCRFCLTGTMGLIRNLRAHEIVDQVLTVQDELGADARLTNVVLMGMGEPLANFEAVAEAVRRLTDPTWGVGLSPRRITVSTAGLASRLQDAAALGVTLAISLNASREDQRRDLMPGAQQLFSLDAVLSACRALPLAHRRRLTFEYVLLAGVNDRDDDAARLARLLRGVRAKVNLIAFNPFPGSLFARPAESQVLRFQSILRRAGFDVFVRKSRGRDVLGACGQLGVLPPQPELLQPSPVGAHA